MGKERKDKSKHDCAFSVFELLNERGYYAPIIDFHYQEKSGDRAWHVNIGGRRIYVLGFGNFKRISDTTIEEEALNSHLFVQTICACLAVIGCGLFRFRAVGRIVLKAMQAKEWGVDLRPNDPHAKIESDEVIKAAFVDWFGACSNDTMIRRSLDDLYNSLIYPKEAPIFVYRALEWIKEGMEISWDEIPRYLDLPQSEMKEFKKLLHDPEVAVRHGRKSGKKLRADAALFGAWSANILEILNAIRKEAEPDFSPMKPEQIAKAISRCAPLVIFD